MFNFFQKKSEPFKINRDYQSRFSLIKDYGIQKPELYSGWTESQEEKCPLFFEIPHSTLETLINYKFADPNAYKFDSSITNINFKMIGDNLFNTYPGTIKSLKYTGYATHHASEDYGIIIDGIKIELHCRFNSKDIPALASIGKTASHLKLDNFNFSALWLRDINN